MADIAFDPQNTNTKELYGQGVRAYVLQDYDTAVRAFSRASELLAAEHKSDLHDSLGDVYLYYGKSLLELSRKESGAIGDGVLKSVDQASESEEVESEDEDENKSEQETKPEEKTQAQKEKGVVEGVPDAPVTIESAREEIKTDESTVTESKEQEPAEENEDDLSDLQVAWEVLELAKQIFTNRGQGGNKFLAETYIVLGEVSLESGNYASAIEDITEGLEIQKGLFGSDSRTIAETFYKLGGAYATNGQIDEAIENFYASYEYLSNRVANLKLNEANDESNTEEIEELNTLIPEIQEKIADMKNFKLEITTKVSSAVDDATTNGTSQSTSSSKPASDISHLVKRKRQQEEATEEKDENPPKRPSQ